MNKDLLNLDLLVFLVKDYTTAEFILFIFYKIADFRCYYIPMCLDGVGVLLKHANLISD